MENSTYYVGIGASAGGLEALESLFKNMPDDTGLVFIVVQHLSPDYKSLMNELLARYTDMEILIAEDGMETTTNKIYLIPPRKNLSIFHGRLYLENQEHKKHHMYLPIDIFFKSLAQDQCKNAIGIILSGTGSDGTMGVRAIKEVGGMVMVQDEQSAKFDGMPRSSINTGLVDYILPPQAMPAELLNFIDHPSVRNLSGDEPTDIEVDDLTKINMIIRNYSGIDFTGYKQNTMQRRIDRRLKINRFTKVKEYADFLYESDKEQEVLLRELLIGVTSFFRDREAFDVLKEKVLPKLDYSKGQLRIWSAGCSTGEEVYSLAIIINEYMQENNIHCELKLFATDVDANALDVAGIGYYPESIISDVESKLITRYFSKKEEGYQVNDTIRKQIVFAKHNIIKDPPFSKLDLLVCRNLFIYLKSELQQKVLSSFYYSLSNKGYLFLGSSESLGDISEAFHVIDSKWKLYCYREGYKPDLRSSFSFSTDHIRIHIDKNLMDRPKKNVWLEQLLMQVFKQQLPPSVIVDQNENILQIIGDVSAYMGIQTGRFSNKVSANMSKDLALFVNNILMRIRIERRTVIISNITPFMDKSLQITLKGSLIELGDTDYILISFLREENRKQEIVEISLSNGENERVKQLEIELQQAREGLQATVEELETSNEELQSSNEELIASNEELQSTNEELQSVNEELYTVNNEHQYKIEQLTALSNDLNNLLRNTEVGALYLDSRFCIRRITPVVSKITNIMEADIGRPISHIAVMDNYKDILKDIDSVMETLIGIERNILDKEGNTWLVRILPFRAENNVIDGIVLTFVDISRLKMEEEKNAVYLARLSNVMKLGQVAWWEYDLRTNCVVYSDGKATMLGYKPEEFPNDVYEICSLLHPEDYEATMEAMRNYIMGVSPEWNITYRIKRKDGTYAWYHDVGHITERTKAGKPLKLVGAVINISDIRDLERTISKMNQQSES